MQILILGSGLMGPAAAYNALTDARVAQVTLADKDAAQLEAARARLTPLLATPSRLETAVVDLAAGRVPLVGEALHLPELASVFVLWRMARPRRAAALRSRRRGGARTPQPVGPVRPR